jgi:hypothetical protein
MTEKRFTLAYEKGNWWAVRDRDITLWKEEVVGLLNELVEENEQLKQYIYDNLDEDICDVCSYQYLEKSQMDKYYVAKCKKGYDNCSKGTVIHCKDFKFKELKMND